MILCASSAVSGAGAGWAGAGGTVTGGAAGAGAVVFAGAAKVRDGVGLGDAAGLPLALGLGALVPGAELDASGPLPHPPRSRADSARASVAPRAGV